MTWVKICGMTNLEDALTAVEAGADAVGFVFYEKSPRNISVEAAREIVEKLPEGVEKVGVFVDLESEQIREIVAAVGLSAVQLYGSTSMNCIWGTLRPPREWLGASKLIPVVYGDALKDGGFLIGQQDRDQIFALLLDSRSDGTAGGHRIRDTGLTGRAGARHSTGHQGAWRVLQIVAGGLTPANVPGKRCVTLPSDLRVGCGFRSGGEAREEKDPEQVWAFVKAVRDTDRKAR